MPANILIVDDEPAMRQMLVFALRQAGFSTRETGNVAEAHTALLEGRPDLILLDWMLPGVSGLDYARRLRKEKFAQGIPIILLTARAAEEDKLRGLDGGADDYVTKPFSPRELISRIRALLRRAAPHAADVAFEIGGLAMDPATHRVTAHGQAVALGPTEFRLLNFLMAHPERVHSREKLLNSVWGDQSDIEERTVDVHIRRLRRALEATGHDTLIQTVRGTGYRFSTQPSSQPKQAL